MPTSLNEFVFPIRDAELLFSEDATYTNEDRAADAEFNQRNLEDYLNNVLPNIFVSLSEIGSGTIDPAQLATGTPGAGKAPVGNPPAWTDVVEQTELTTFYGTTLFGQDIQRGRTVLTAVNGTNTAFAIAFSTTFAAAPRVVATVECGERAPFFPTLTVVNTTSFAGFITTTSATSITATVAIHWHATRQ